MENIKESIEYPPYYRSVFVKYRIKGTNIIKTQKMWLAVNVKGKHIWTDACNNTHVWTDEEIEVINWWNCSTQGSDGSIEIDSRKNI